MLVRWHLLSLDAPTVAILWCALFVRAARAPVPVPAMELLAAGTWCLYVLDRLLDARRRREGLRPRHRFHARHAERFATGVALAILALAALVVPRMSSVILRDDAVMAALVAAYFLFVHLSERPPFPKELCVGLVFAAAAAEPAYARAGRPAALIPAAALLGLLCWWNCAAIQLWEDAAGASAPEREDIGRRLRRGAAGLALLAAAGLIFAGSTRMLFCAALISAAGCWLLAWRAPRMDALRLRVAADLVLCSPLILLAFGAA